MADAETTVLVVDDKHEFVSTIEHILVSENYAVVTATGAKHAMQQFKTTRPDIVLLDVNLPDGNGLTLTPQFKKAQQNKKWLPVLLFSSDATIDNQLQGYHAGCDNYLTKPLDPQILLAKLTVIRRILALIP